MFLGLASGFTFWQRMYLPKGFWIFTWTFGALSGIAFASIKTGYYGIEQLDKLGKEYELSRMVKQDIFDTRTDLDSDVRALVYMKQNEQNEAYDQQQSSFRR